MRVREAEVEDLDRLLELYGEPNELYAEAAELEGEEARRRFEEVRADEHQKTLVADENGQVVGTLVVVILPNLAHGGAPYAVVENVVVDGSRRGEGIGRALLREAMERARAAGAYKLSLSANLARERAHRFYRGLGLKETHLGFEVKL
jgi:ribosomal protein S18 acetylase RimI-like enzyme